MSNQSKSRSVVIAALTTGLVLLSVLLWQQHVKLELLRQHNVRLTEQVRLCQQKEPSDANEAAATPAPSANGSPRSASASTAAPAPVAGTDAAAVASNTAPLVLGSIVVKPLSNSASPDGLLASLPLVRNRTDPLGVVHVFVRLPKNSNGRIVDFTPADATSYTNVRKYVKADGKFAAFEGTPTANGPLQLELSVSTSVNADIRGACEIGAIGPYQVAIAPSGATVHGE